MWISSYGHLHISVVSNVTCPKQNAASVNPPRRVLFVLPATEIWKLGVVLSPARHLPSWVKSTRVDCCASDPPFHGLAQAVTVSGEFFLLDFMVLDFVFSHIPHCFAHCSQNFLHSLYLPLCTQNKLILIPGSEPQPVLVESITSQ